MMAMRSTPTAPTRSSIDTDGDELDDDAEIDTYGTDPTDSDTDDDVLTDWFEAIPGPNWQGNTDPLDSDTDDDGLGDGDEENCTAPCRMRPTATTTH